MIICHARWATKWLSREEAVPSQLRFRGQILHKLLSFKDIGTSDHMPGSHLKSVLYTVRISNIDSVQDRTLAFLETDNYDGLLIGIDQQHGGTFFKFKGAHGVF